MGSGKRWRMWLQRTSTANTYQDTDQPPPPEELKCPISGNLMWDPVIVSSGHTYERSIANALNTMRSNPFDPHQTDFTTIIPNLALKSTILTYAQTHSLQIPPPPSPHSAHALVQSILTKHSTSDDSVDTVISSSPSSESSDSEDQRMVSNLRSTQLVDQQQALSSLRNLTRSDHQSRVSLCTPRSLSALRSLILSSYIPVQVNALASLVNLSLATENKVRIVRSGIVPGLVLVLRTGLPEPQEHASGALFSLALEDSNKTAIGVLGALPPLVRALRSGTVRARHDSAMALYHLSTVQSNCAKLVKLGAVLTLLGIARSGQMEARVLPVICNLAMCSVGRGAILDGGGVECFAEILRGKDESAKESCVGALYALSQGGLRFKGLARSAGIVEILSFFLDKSWSDKAKEKAWRVLDSIRVRGGKDEEEEDLDWEELLGLESQANVSQSESDSKWTELEDKWCDLEARWCEL